MIELPDWKDPAAYPQPGKASNARLAWEFLRRNANFQATWVEYIRLLRFGAGQDEELLRLVAYLDAVAAERGRIAASSFPSPDAWNHAFMRLHELPCFTVVSTAEDGRRWRVPLDRAMAKPWGLEVLTSPRLEYDIERVRFISSKAVRVPTSHGLAELEQTGNDGLPPDKWLILQVDLEWPSDVIEDRVLQVIRSRRKWLASEGRINPIKGRARVAEWLECLRVLDARARSVTYAKIGEAICPGEPNAYPEYGRDKRLKAVHKAGCRLRDGDYRMLPVLQDRLVKAKVSTET